MLIDLHTWEELPLTLSVADATQVRSGQADKLDSLWCTPKTADSFLYEECELYKFLNETHLLQI